MNLYCHFPFCRRKCAYCALHSRAGVSAARRAAHVRRLVREVRARNPNGITTLYFGGGTPALCDLAPLLGELAPRRAADCEWTVELHPCDVTPPLLETLAAAGVNRLSLGVQTLDDATLAAMGRGHTAAEALAAFRRMRAAGFENAGLDLIAGYPGVTAARWRQTLESVLSLAPAHVSCYTLIREPQTRLSRAVQEGRLVLPDDDAALAQFHDARCAFESAGLRRYEISNFARPGFECRHNLAVWRGADYIGLGEGAAGREGLSRTEGTPDGYAMTAVSPAADDQERDLFRWRLTEGVPPEVMAARGWQQAAQFFVREGLATFTPAGACALTTRGFEVCDSLLAELVVGSR